MNVITAVKMYITKMAEESGPGMKVLLMDKQTTSIVSMVYSQSEILQKEVYLFERIDTPSSSEPMKHLRCIIFVRPTKENIKLLCNELDNPRYGFYYIYFSNIIQKTWVKELAECDKIEVVREVQEFYGDYLAVNPHLFSLNLHGCYERKAWRTDYLQRSIQGIVSVLLSLKKCPYIRYQASSDMAKILARKVLDTINTEDSLFDFRQQDVPPVLLILDRKSDAFTPLLTQWTYQAMVHELITITNNRVNLSHIPGIAKELNEVVLSSEHDEFYADNLYVNYGEIGQTMKQLIEEFQSKAQSHQRVESVADMKRFVDNYPQFKKMSGTVTKHLSLISEMSNLVTKRSLLEISELEQEMVCQDQHAQHLQRVKEFIANKSVRNEEVCKLVMIYALRYNTYPNFALNSLKESLRKRGVQQKLIELIEPVMKFGSQESSIEYSQNPVKITKRFFQDLKGVDNVFTQHVPVFKETLEDLIRGRLRDTKFPTLFPLGRQVQGKRVQDVILFVIGGVTYEESYCVYQLNKSSLHGGARIILGGTTIHNSASFIDEIANSS